LQAGVDVQIFEQNPFIAASPRLREKRLLLGKRTVAVERLPAGERAYEILKSLGITGRSFRSRGIEMPGFASGTRRIWRPLLAAGALKEHFPQERQRNRRVLQIL
jgi:hypothetical protein